MDIPIENFIATLELFESRHKTDDEHGSRTSMLALVIGKRLNGGQRLDAEKLKLLDYAARIHDLGRAVIDDYIVSKPGKLTASQQSAMRSHSILGHDLLKHSGLPVEIKNTVLYHHEHWDGSGYPEGLLGMDIPLFARIVCIADAWDAITHERPYHKARNHEKALEEMNRVAGCFDPKLYAIFLSALKEQAINGR